MENKYLEKIASSRWQLEALKKGLISDTSSLRNSPTRSPLGLTSQLNVMKKTRLGYGTRPAGGTGTPGATRGLGASAQSATLATKLQDKGLGGYYVRTKSSFPGKSLKNEKLL